jgi:RNA polymerase sigma-70 factor (ECF subfamily)
MVPVRDVPPELAALHTASWGWALACAGRDADRAHDALQQAYWKVLSGRARWGGHSTFKTWFFGVIRLTAKEQTRWFARRVEPPQAEVPASAPLPDSSAARTERAKLLSHALARIAPRQREVLHLVFYEDMTIAEAAVVMGVSLGTARQHYERGKKALAALLGDPHDG